MPRGVFREVLAEFFGTFILIVFGICLKWAIFPNVLSMVLNKEVDLQEGTSVYDAWVREQQT